LRLRGEEPSALRVFKGNYYISYIKHIIYILLFLISFNGTAQEYADKEYYLIDSLVLEELSEGDRELLNNSLKEYHSAKDDTSKIKALSSICENMMAEDWKKYQYFLYEQLQITLKKNLSKRVRKALQIYLARSLNNIGLILKKRGLLKESADYYYGSLKIREEIGDKKGIANSLHNISELYQVQGQMKEALDCVHRSLKIQEKIGDKDGTANSLNSIGTLYKLQDQIKEALDYYHRSLKIFEEIGNKAGIVACFNNIGLIYVGQVKYKEALDYLHRSLEIREEILDKEGSAHSLHNIGFIHQRQGEYKEALDYFYRSLEIREEIGNKTVIAETLIQIGSIYHVKGENEEALDYGLKSIWIAQEIGLPKTIRYASELLSTVYEAKGEGIKALEMYKLHVQMKDSINNEETQKAAIRQQTKYEFEKAQIVKENEAKEQARLEAEETSRRNNLQYSLIFLGILVLFVGILLMGFIKVSPNVAEGLIFFAFLILFEFVLVFTEPYLEQYTNGEPMYNLLANSVLALLIFPVHAILEKLLKKRIVKV